MTILSEDLFEEIAADLEDAVPCEACSEIATHYMKCPPSGCAYFYCDVHTELIKRNLLLYEAANILVHCMRCETSDIDPAEVKIRKL